MAVTIKNLYEVSGTPLLRERLANGQKANVYTGLGPEDLVALDKLGKGFLQATVGGTYYHHLSGVRHAPNTFPAYYAELQKRQEPGSRMPTAKKYAIGKGRLFSWNSFRAIDTCVTVKSQTEPEAHNLVKGSSEKMNETDWYEVGLSAALRFYRAGQPVIQAIVGCGMAAPKAVALSVRRMEPLSMKDLVYVLDHHTIDNEVASAMANAVIIGFENSEIIRFLKEQGHRIPLIFAHILKVMSPRSVIAEELISLADGQWMRYCDNVDLALQLVRFIMGRGGDYRRYLPLVRGAAWCDPMAVLCLAEIAMLEENYEKVFDLINASTHSVNVGGITLDFSQPMLTKPTVATPFKSGYEGKLIGAPCVGVNATCFAMLAEVVERLTVTEFKATLFRKMTDGKQLASSNTVSPVRLGSRGRYNQESEEDMSLCDPGVEDKGSAELKIIGKLPYSESFKTMVSDVLNALNRRDDILGALQGSKDKPRESVTAVLVLGLRLKSRELIHKGFEISLRDSSKASGLGKLVLLKAAMEGMGPNLDDVFSMKIDTVAVSEANALALIEDLAIALDR